MFPMYELCSHKARICSELRWPEIPQQSYYLASVRRLPCLHSRSIRNELQSLFRFLLWQIQVLCKTEAGHSWSIQCPGLVASKCRCGAVEWGWRGQRRVGRVGCVDGQDGCGSFSDTRLTDLQGWSLSAKALSVWFTPYYHFVIVLRIWGRGLKQIRSYQIHVLFSSFAAAFFERLEMAWVISRLPMQYIQVNRTQARSLGCSRCKGLEKIPSCCCGCRKALLCCNSGSGPCRAWALLYRNKSEASCATVVLPFDFGTSSSS